MRQYDLMPRAEAERLCKELNSRAWKEKKSVIDQSSGTRKHNLETIDKRLSEGLQKSLAGHEELIRENLVQHILPPMFSKYVRGAQYDMHNDAAMIGGIRTDLACTIFLNDDYEGGELCIGGLKVIGKAGMCVVYDCWRPHYVSPVLEGERVCAVTWMQSMIRGAEKRQIMNQFQAAILDIQNKGVNHYVPLASVYGKLLRMWVD